MTISCKAEFLIATFITMWYGTMIHYSVDSGLSASYFPHSFPNTLFFCTGQQPRFILLCVLSVFCWSHRILRATCAEHCFGISTWLSPAFGKEHSSLSSLKIPLLLSILLFLHSNYNINIYYPSDLGSSTPQNFVKICGINYQVLAPAWPEIWLTPM